MHTLRKIFERRLYRTIAIGGVTLMLFVGVIIATRSYAVAEVNGTAISVNDFKLNYAAAKVYYNTLTDEYTKNNIKTKELSDKELRASILDQLIETTIIDQALRKKMGDTTDDVVANKIKEYTNDATLTTAAENLYGFSSADFAREVLIPQAKTDILRGALFLETIDFPTWLTQAKQAAAVKIFSDDYTWDGTVVHAQ